MNASPANPGLDPRDIADTGARAHAHPGSEKILVSVVLPAFNEAAILEKNLGELCTYMDSLSDEYQWEIIIVNDGSSDDTGAIAEAFARTRDDIEVIHHHRNFGLGQAFKSAFNRCTGTYVVTLDVDLSYSPEHIGEMLKKIREERAKFVLASPYMPGGRLGHVPWLRRTMSIWANRFLSLLAAGNLSTLTCMVRAYDGQFLRSLDLRSVGMEVMPEMIYKGMILRGKIVQIPAHLDWEAQAVTGVQRQSSMRMFRHIISTLLSGLLFKPFMFFIAPGLALLLFSSYVNIWMLIHFFDHYGQLGQYGGLFERASAAVAAAYAQAPHTFIVGGLSLMLAIQLISLGVLALQNKRYFEEMFHVATSIYKSTLKGQSDKDGNRASI